ncbi:DsbA family protein [Pendulispora rubella]|uniref:DsbA family protein n=1 Tax=Pendulispora rubella TaxID=2741070 RepID=A0ABZ2KXK6_9BACT
MKLQQQNSRRVELFLDLTCIHSYIGFTRFERAADRYRKGGGELVVVFRPFEVAPYASVVGEPLRDVHRRHFGDNAARLVNKMAIVGAQEGLPFNFAQAVHVRTFDAHRVLAAAAHQGRGELMAERLFRAYLIEGQNIGHRATLARLATEVGVTISDGGVMELEAELARVLQMGIRSVPVVRFSDGLTLLGSQSESAYLEALHAPAVA